MKIPRKTTIGMKKTTLVEEVETDAVEAALAVEDAMQSRLINRRNHIRALLLAVVARQNILFEGPPGTAKTLTGSLFASAVTGDFVFFKTQMLKSSLPEQLFGPININSMRKDRPVYEYFTEGMLPSAHFAIIEEVYRASEMVLSAMLTIFNERKFHNGGRIVDCPLMTAIGTTNFVSTGEEIEAFNDRWLIRAKVESLQSESQRREMYGLAEIAHKPLKADISLDQIRELQAKCDEVTLPSILLDMYARMVSLMQPDSSIPLTDRRQVQVLDLIKASAVLNKREEANPEDIAAAEYGFTILGDAKSGAAFANAFQKTVGNYEKMKEENEELSQLRERMEKYVSVFDEKMPKDKATKLQTACRNMVDVMTRRSTTYSSQAAEDEFQRILTRIRELLQDVTELLAN